MERRGQPWEDTVGGWVSGGDGEGEGKGGGWTWGICSLGTLDGEVRWEAGMWEGR